MGNLSALVSIFFCVFHNTGAVPTPGVVRQTNTNPIVNSNVGQIRGLTSANGEYSMFLGIPYATVNISNVFGQSIPHPAFETPYDAFDDSRICPHMEELTPNIVGSLDCLNLNVYVPNTANSGNLPVMVWIHGGGYVWGSSERSVYGPDFLVRHDVILVTLNYRLGIYGFMCLDIPEVPGNQGFRDQWTALRWVKNNIQAFGGDNNRITLFGESAGSMGVDYHYLYGGDDLFHRVILQSGVALAPGSGINVPSRRNPFALAQYLGLETSDVYEALTYLSTIDTQRVVEASVVLNTAENGNPCIENQFDGIESFINVHPLIAPDTRNIPVMIGCNAQETLPEFIDQDIGFFENIDIFFEFSVSALINATRDHMDDMVNNFRRFYLSSDNYPSDRFNENIRWDLTAMSDDIFFTHPMHRTALKYASNGTTPVYMYVFSYVGERNLWRNRLNSTEGSAVHYDEIAYLFQRGSFENVSITAEDQLTIDRMTLMWTNFAKFGNPTPETSTLVPVQWPVTTEETLNYLSIDRNLTVDRRPWHNRMAYLDLFYELNRDYLIGIPTQSSSIAFIHPLLAASLTFLYMWL